MTTPSNVCTCDTCAGAECTCGCQTAASAPPPSCQCGDTCTCGPTCTCAACQHTDPSAAESR